MNVENEGPDGGDDLPAEVLREAESFGWKPKDRYKGDPDSWVPADEFLERSKHVLPIVVANNKRLQQALLTRDQKIDNLAKSLEDSQKVIKALQKSHTEATQRAVDAAIARTKAELKEAVEERDVDAELRLRDKLDDLKKAKNDAATTATVDEPGEKKNDPPPLHPDLKAWMEENPWYGEDKKRTRAITRVMEDLRDEGETATGRAFLDMALERLQEKDPERKPSSKVESGNHVMTGERPGSGRKKSYASLPKDAKEACDSFADQLVGPGKAYKTLEEWRNHFVANYEG